MDSNKELLNFNMDDAQELVNAYVACGKYVEACRLLTVMKEKTLYDINVFSDDEKCSLITAILIDFLRDSFVPDIDKQLADIRRKIRSGM